MRKSRLLFLVVALSGIARQLTAQVSDRLIFETSVGRTSSVGGQYVERRMQAIHFGVGHRIKGMNHAAVLAGATAGVTARFNGTNPTCTPGPDLRCLPLMPSTTSASLILIASVGGNHGSVSVASGPGLSRVIPDVQSPGRSTNALHLQGAAQATLRVSKHSSLLMSQRWIVLPDVLGSRITIASTNIGLRLR